MSEGPSVDLICDDPENFPPPQKVVTPEVMKGWIRRARRKLCSEGATVIKVTPKGKLVKRQLFVGAKPHYLELISAKLFDTAYFLGDIVKAEHGLNSQDFQAFKDLEPERL